MDSYEKVSFLFVSMRLVQSITPWFKKWGKKAMMIDLIILMQFFKMNPANRGIFYSSADMIVNMN